MRRAQSVPEFCQSYNISRSLFYKLIREGHGPRIMKVGRRTLITPESSDEWCKRMERFRQGHGDIHA